MDRNTEARFREFLSQQAIPARRNPRYRKTIWGVVAAALFGTLCITAFVMRDQIYKYLPAYIRNYTLWQKTNLGSTPDEICSNLAVLKIEKHQIFGDISEEKIRTLGEFYIIEPLGGRKSPLIPDSYQCFTNVKSTRQDGAITLGVVLFDIPPDGKIFEFRVDILTDHFLVWKL